MEERKREKQQYPIDERCKDCSLFQVVEDIKKQLKYQEEKLKIQTEKIEKLEKELEQYRKPQKDSSNSSIPPSNNKWEKKYPFKEKTNRKTGGQNGHKGTNKAYIENSDEIINLDNGICPYCGGMHFIENEKKIKRKQLIDIKIAPYTKEYVQHHLICEKCKRKVPNIPFEQAGNIEYGNLIQALSTYLNVQGNMSYERITKFFKEVCHIDISEGSIDNILNTIAKKHEINAEKILSELKKSKVIGSDETSIRINKENKYLWVLQNELYTYFSNGNRSFEKLNEIIGEEFNGVWVSDRYNAQLKLNCSHQLCLSHIIRECRYLIESEKSKFAEKLKELLQNAIKLRNKHGTEYEPFKPDIFRKVQKLKEEMIKIFKKRPKKKEQDSLKLWKSLIPRVNQLLLFLEYKNVPPTNNASERGLRNAVTKRKVSGCHRSKNGADRFCIISSIIETAKKQSIDILQAISGNFSFA